MKEIELLIKFTAPKNGYFYAFNRRCMKIRKFLAFWLLIICCSGAFAQPRNFRHYRTEDGLQSNTILSCMQDSNGFIWIGTKDGLSIFDGSEFRNFEAAGAA